MIHLATCQYVVIQLDFTFCLKKKQVYRPTDHSRDQDRQGRHLPGS
jgi:hypothetical protein